jgi:membrane associated rhomboid family serine protease
MVAQITAGAQVEREMGTVPFLIVYMAGGIYGFVLGGNFGRVGIPSVGASGALFATVSKLIRSGTTQHCAGVASTRGDEAGFS